MRQVLAMKPLASAMRYGGFLAGYWKNFVSLVNGTKQSGSAAGPDTVFGPASDDAEFRPQAAVMRAATAALRNTLRVRFMSSSLVAAITFPCRAAAAWYRPTKENRAFSVRTWK